MITASNAKDYLPLLQALIEGKTLQLRVCDNWLDCKDGVDFTCAPSDYRIKPEPREFWMVMPYATEGLGVCSTKASAEYWLKDYPKASIVHVREVLP